MALRESHISSRPSSNLVNRSTVNRSSGIGRTTVRRESTLNQLVDNSANIHPAVLGPREKLVPNKRGILKCQMWKVAVLRPRPTDPDLTKTKKFKIQYPMATVSICKNFYIDSNLNFRAISRYIVQGVIYFLKIEISIWNIAL